MNELIKKLIQRKDIQELIADRMDAGDMVFDNAIYFNAKMETSLITQLVEELQEQQTGEFYLFWKPETKEYGEVMYNYDKERYEVFADPDQGYEPHVFCRELMDDYVKAKLIMNGFELRKTTLIIHDKEQ